MNKKVLSVAMAGAIVFSSLGTVVYADKFINNEVIGVENENIKNVIVVKTKKVELKSDHLIDINIPQVEGLKNKKYEKELNKKIEDEINQKLNLFKEDATEWNQEKSELYVDYEIKMNDNILSILINSYEILAGDANGESRVNIYNIDLKENKDMKLKDLFKDDVDYKKIVNNEIKNQISERDDDLLEGEDGFKSISDDQLFYVDENGNLVIVFNVYEIGPRVAGRPTFVIDSNKIVDDIKSDMIVKPIVVNKKIDLNILDENNINIPVIKGMKNKKSELEINKHINDVIVKNINEFNDYIKDIKTEGNAEIIVSYKTESKGNILSVVVDVFKSVPGMAHPENEKYYFNMDIKEDKLINIADLFKDDANYKQIINDEIKKQISLEKENYFEGEDGFKSISEEQNFYIDDLGNIIIEFDKYEIAPGSTGIPVFKVAGYKVKDGLKDNYSKNVLKELSKIYIDGFEFKLENPMYISEDGEVMLPISEIAKKLDYDINWDSNKNEVLLSYDDVKIRVSTVENEYYFNDGLIVLKKGAEIKNGATYIPLEFIEKIIHSNVEIKDGLLNIRN